MTNLVAVAALSLLVVPKVGFGQSLGEAAAKEKARRKALEESSKKPVPSYSDADLGRAKGTNASFPSAEGGDSTDPAAKKEAGGSGPKDPKDKEKTEDEKKAEASAAWRKSLDASNKAASTYRDQIAKIQNDLNDTSGGLYSNRRTTLLGFLDDTKKKLADEEAKIADLEDQGRRNGYR
jgi:hypothetical protein